MWYPVQTGLEVWHDPSAPNFEPDRWRGHRIKANYGKCIGELSGPRGRVIAYESLLERDFAELMLMRRNTADLISQPLTVVFRSAGQEQSYTPDFLLFRHTGPWALIEVKPSRRIDAAVQQRAEVASVWARIGGGVFELWGDAEIHGEEWRSSHFLLPFRREPSDPETEWELMTWMQGEPMWRLGDLLARMGDYDRAVRSVWRLLSLRILEADLTLPLGLETMIRLPVPQGWGWATNGSTVDEG